MVAADLPPPYTPLAEDATTEQNATEVMISDSDDVPEIYGILFEHKDNRIGFIQKVLLIKLFQALAITLLLVIFAASPDPYRFMNYDRRDRTNLIVISSLLLVGVIVLIHYCDEARFVRPYNYLFLLTYPLSVGLFASVVTWDWGLAVVLICWVHFNFVMFFLLTYSIFALQSKIEFQTSIGLAITAGTLIAAYALTVPFLYGTSAFAILYGSLALFALTAFMLNGIQAMMSTTYRFHLSPSDFVKAALIMHIIDYHSMIMKLFSIIA